MRNDTHRYLIAYDVPSDRRRTRLAKILSGYGDRVQFSVFIVDAARAKLVRLREDVKNVIEQDEDSVLLCDLGLLTTLDDRVFSTIGRSRSLTDADALIV